MSSTQPSHTSSESEVSYWKKPPQMWIKCNYDGSFVKNHPAKAGWIIHNDHKNLLGAGQAQGKITK